MSDMALDMPEMDVYRHEMAIGSIQIQKTGLAMSEMALNIPEMDV